MGKRKRYQEKRTLYHREFYVKKALRLKTMPKDILSKYLQIEEQLKELQAKLRKPKLSELQNLLETKFLLETDFKFFENEYGITKLRNQYRI